MKIKYIYLSGIILTLIYIWLNFKVMVQEEVKAITNSCYGYLNIDKIHLHKCLYEFKDKYNSLDIGLEVYYLNPLLILSHSGPTRNSYFNDLASLEVGDIIEVKYPNINKYEVINIYRKNKTDKLKLKNDLILVTCDLIDISKQIVVEAIKI